MNMSPTENNRKFESSTTLQFSLSLKCAIIAAHQSRKGYKAISKQFEVHPSTVRKWKTFKTVANLPRSGRPSKFTPRSNCAMLKEITKHPRTKPQTRML